MPRRLLWPLALCACSKSGSSAHGAGASGGVGAVEPPAREEPEEAPVQAGPGAGKEAAMSLRIESLAFADGARIPTKFTADGPDVSPPLRWSGAPDGTAAFVLIMDDPDAPVGTWDHWIVYDLPAATTSLPEGVGKGASLPVGAREGRNSWGRAEYGGPSPPPGKPHRYFFKLHALSAATGLDAGAAKAAVEAAMKGKRLGEARWMGTYGR